MIGEILFYKYIILSKIGNGSFGEIYKGENIRTKEFVAIKREKQINNKLLKHEAKIYTYLGKQTGFLELKWFGISNEYSYLVTNLLGDSLKQHKSLLLSEIKSIGVQMVKRIQILHEKSLLHRDIKPDNFVFDQSNTIVYLIDFGLCKSFVTKEGNHIPYKLTKNIIGSVNYVSLNGHDNIELTRRDDLESMLYVLLFLLDMLPWKIDETLTLTNIIELKQNIFHLNIPSTIKRMMTYIRNLSFDETPNYNYIESLINTI